jgi:hypothetical protein
VAVCLGPNECEKTTQVVHPAAKAAIASMRMLCKGQGVTVLVLCSRVLVALLIPLDIIVVFYLIALL